MKGILDYLDRKIRDVFPDESVYKDDDIRAIFGESRKLPSFIKDWLIKRFSEDDRIDKEGILEFLDKYMPQRDTILMELIKERFRSIKVLSRILVKPDIKSGEIRFSLPDLGIKEEEGIIDKTIVDKGIIKSSGEWWGVCEIVYIKEDKKQGYIKLKDFKPFKPYEVDLSYYIDARREFSTEEWIDLLVRSMEFNPEHLTLDQKLTLLCRLSVFVEPNLNLIELAPKGTGKSYVFSNLSKYGLLISGGSVSRAKLFYNKLTKEVGAITKYDFIALDEVQTISFSDPEEMKGILKSYLENGRFSLENYRGEASAGMVLLGNIPLGKDRLPLSENYFEHLPEVFRETALLDRFHGFIEGWKLPRFHEGLKVRGYALNVEYFSDILHMLRDRGEYASYLMDILSIPQKADTRDKKAILKITTALLKLIFPNAPNVGASKADIQTYCLNIAKNLRRTIKQQLHIMDKEYSSDIPDIKIEA